LLSPPTVCCYSQLFSVCSTRRACDFLSFLSYWTLLDMY
jgi:hypothetical protein